MRSLVHKNLIGITQSTLLAGIGKELVGVFLPLLLINRGLALWQVCLFYVGYATIKFLINFPVIMLINRKGAKFGLLYGYGTATVYLLLLTAYVSGYSDIAVWFMPGALALMNAFIWSSTHLHISRVMESSRKSRDLAMIKNMERVVGVATPFIGGFIAAQAGEAWLTLVAALAVAAALFPIWHIDKIAGGHTQANHISYSLKYAPWRDVLANMSYNFHTSVGIMVWPIYLAVFIPNYQSIGIITTIASAIAVAVLHFVGKRGDQGKTHQVLLEGTGTSSAVHIGRIAASSNPLTITLISAFYDIALSYQQNPWTSIYYHHARKRGINYILSMEIAGDIAYLLLWAPLGLIAYFTQNSSFFNFAFISAAIIVWGCMLITKESDS